MYISEIVERCIFETPHNEIKCVLSVKESNFNEKDIKIFTFFTVRAEVADTPLPYGHLMIHFAKKAPL